METKLPVKITGRKKGQKGRKVGRNKKKCEKYRLLGKQEKKQDKACEEAGEKSPQ